MSELDLIMEKINRQFDEITAAVEKINQSLRATLKEAATEEG
jgi:hypothetical protein